MMSGLPVGCEGDKTPVWITTSWPPETQDILDYQWNQVAIPAWKKLVKLAEDCGIERIALENHGMMLDTKPIDAFARRSWNYVAVGAGHDAKWWKEFSRLSACRATTMRFPLKWKI